MYWIFSILVDAVVEVVVVAAAASVDEFLRIG